ncbi:MAG: metallophosphoesterase [Armatimonadota bacterium]
MRYRKALILLLLLLCIPAIANDNGFMFIQIADPQLGFSEKDKNVTQEVKNFEKAVKHINQLQPAFVVISGDLVNRKHDAEQINAFWKVAKKIRPEIPLFLVSGNHDLAPATESDVQSYRKMFGTDYYSFTYGGSTFLVLDSSVIHYTEGDQVIRKAQRGWFESQLAEARKNNADHIFVLTHHPWFINNPDEVDANDNIPLAERKDYLSLMSTYGVDYALAGHLHMEVFGQYGKLSLITTGPLSKSFTRTPVGFRVFKVYKDKVEHEYYPLDKVPEHIEVNK